MSAEEIKNTSTTDGSAKTSEVNEDICEGEYAAQRLDCQWCGEEVTRFYIESGDCYLPEHNGSFICGDCGNETLAVNISVDLKVRAGKGRDKDRVLWDRNEHQARLQDYVNRLRRDWATIKVRRSIWCKIAGHSWTIVARGTDSKGQTRFDGVNGAMAYCNNCDYRHDDLSGNVSWVTGA